MKIISQQVVTVLHIEYPNTVEGRKAVFDWLDEKCPNFGYSVKRSGPKGGGADFQTGLIIVHLDGVYNG